MTGTLRSLAEGPFRVLGHPLVMNLPAEAASAITRFWPTHSPGRIGRPIHIGTGEVPWDPHRPARALRLYERDIDLQLTGDGFVQRLGEGRLHARVQASHVEITLQGDLESLELLIRSSIGEAIVLGGLIPFHAAAIARGGRSAMLIAPSKTGKSTTLVTAALAGYLPVGEDLIWVDPSTRAVYSSDCEIRLWPDSLQRFDAHFPAAVQRPDGKYCLPLETLPGYPPGESRLRRIVVLRRDLAQASAVEGIPQLELVRALWESTCLPLTPQGQRFAESGIGALVRDLPFCKLVIGNTPLDFEPLLA